MDTMKYRITLDCARTDTQGFIYANKGECSGRRIIMTLMNEGTVYGIAEGCSATLTAVKPDSTFVVAELRNIRERR